MVRTPSYDKNGIKKGAWSPEEDRKLEVYIRRYGHWNWRELPKFAGLKRCGKSCRLRWMNYLRPNVKRGNYTKDEENMILELHEKEGNKWAMIASKLPGRTDNEIKNYWHTHLKKRQRKEKTATTTSSDSKSHKSSGGENSDSERSQKHVSNRDESSPSHEITAQDCFQHVQILESCPLPPQMPTSSTSLSSSTSLTHGGFEEIMSSPDQLFAEFTSPSLLDPQTNEGCIFGSGNGVFVGETESLMDTAGGLEDDDFWTKPFDVEDMSYNSFIHNSSDDNDELLLSSYMVYYNESMIDLFCR